MAMGQMQKTIKLNVKVAEDLWPYQVVDEIQKVMEEGLRKHPDIAWLTQSPAFHITRAVNHLNARRISGSGNEDHLAHAFTRLMMAMAIERGYADPVVKDEEDADA